MRRYLAYAAVFPWVACVAASEAANDRAALCSRVAKVQLTSFEAAYQSENGLNPMVVGYHASTGGWYVIASSGISTSTGDGVSWVRGGESRQLQPTPDSGLRRTDASVLERHVIPTLFVQRLCEMPEANVSVVQEGEWLVGEVVLPAGSRASIIKPLPSGMHATPTASRFWVAPSGRVEKMQIGSGPIAEIQYGDPARPWLATSFSYGLTVLKLERVDPLPASMAGGITPSAVERRVRQPWRVSREVMILTTSSSNPDAVAALTARASGQPIGPPPTPQALQPSSDSGSHPGLARRTTGRELIRISPATSIDDAFAEPRNAPVLGIGVLERYRVPIAWCGGVLLALGLAGIARRRWIDKA
jgi:hypothetical protein